MFIVFLLVLWVPCNIKHTEKLKEWYSKHCILVTKIYQLVVFRCVYVYQNGFFGEPLESFMTLLDKLNVWMCFQSNDLFTFYLSCICCQYFFSLIICFWLWFLVFLRWWHAMPCQYPDHRAVWHRIDWWRSAALLWACAQTSCAGRDLGPPSATLLCSLLARTGLLDAPRSAQPEPSVLHYTP